jgi:hypothetical protein
MFFVRFAARVLHCRGPMLLAIDWNATFAISAKRLYPGSILGRGDFLAFARFDSFRCFAIVVFLGLCV